MILGGMQTQLEDECMKVVQSCGFNVEKEELKAALMYDREQYSKGYADGYNKAIDEYVNRLCYHCIEQPNECWKLECPFCGDGCDIVNIAEQMKAGGKNG